MQDKIYTHRHGGSFTKAFASHAGGRGFDLKVFKTNSDSSTAKRSTAEYRSNFETLHR